jgi:hypothetical protein
MVVGSGVREFVSSWGRGVGSSGVRGVVGSWVRGEIS